MTFPKKGLQKQLAFVFCRRKGETLKKEYVAEGLILEPLLKAQNRFFERFPTLVALVALACGLHAQSFTPVTWHGTDNPDLTQEEVKTETGFEGKILLLARMVVFLHRDGSPAEDITVTGQLKAPGGEGIWGGILYPQKGRIVLRGSPGSIWEILLKGKASPGQKIAYNYTLRPGEKTIIEVRLPW